SEMAARGGMGMRLELERVPVREEGMRPDEILLSESQERMLLVVAPGATGRVAEIYRRWGLRAAVVGDVVAAPSLTVHSGGTPMETAGSRISIPIAGRGGRWPRLQPTSPVWGQRRLDSPTV